MENTDIKAADEYPEIGKLLTALENSERRYDIEKIERAYLYAKSLHEGQYRVSGEP